MGFDIADKYFQGIFDSGDFESGMRPGSHNLMLMKEVIMGDGPLSAILQLAGSKMIKEIEHKWWEEGVPSMHLRVGGTAGLTGTGGNGVFTDSALTSLAQTPTAGTELWLKVVNDGSVNTSTDILDTLRLNEVVQLRAGNKLPEIWTGHLTGKGTTAGGVKYLVIKLLTSVSSGLGVDMRDVDSVKVIGDFIPEGSTRQQTLFQQRTQYSNITEIFREDVELSGTALQIAQYVEKNSEGQSEQMKAKSVQAAYDRQMRKMEESLIYGTMYSGTGSNGKPARNMQGLVNHLKSYAPNNVVHFPNDANYGSSWINNGLDWLDAQSENIGRFGKSSTRIVWCGLGVLTAISQLVRKHNSVQFQMSTDKRDFGIVITNLHTPTITYQFRPHPLMRIDPARSSHALVMDFSNVEWINMAGRAQKYYGPKEAQTLDGLENMDGFDGTRGCWLAESTAEYHFPHQMLYWTGIGQDTGSDGGGLI